MSCFLAAWLAFLMPASLAAQPVNVPEELWSLTRDIEIISRWPQRDRMQEDRITADLYRPHTEGRIPAAVIINSSGGITAHTELFYARVFARNGIAALVIDSFRPRGVRRTGDDQTRVAQSQSNADAIAGFRWLAEQSWVDPSRIIVLGMSRGGEAAYSAALEVLRRHYQATDIRFAAHIAIATGSCNLQQRDARTTGAPIFFMLAELDDGTPVLPCIEYIGRMRAAGNPNIRWAVYPGVYHAYEWTGGISFAPDDWTGRACAGRFWRDERGRLYERSSGQLATQGNQTEFLFRTCLQTGFTTGGDERVKAQATADLLQSLRDAEILTDAEARAIVPDCSAIPEGIHRRNCVRARNGWTGDLVALARAFKHNTGVRRDDALAARLFELAASRNHPQAQWELAIMLRQGSAIARDLPRALRLAAAAAEAGDPAGMNTYGAMIRDGIGRARDDAEAAIWFRRASDLRNSYGMTNLAQLMWDGRGGFGVDRPAAVALWRYAVYQDGNPWAQLFLAQALEQGQGIAQSTAEALSLYQAAATQDREPVAKRRASDALDRLRAR
jgi:TPR repeat protein/dienelactone hydrolase